MTTLTFFDNGWTVVTSAWTVATRRNDRIEIHYAWGSVAPGVWIKDVRMAMSTFEDRLRDCGGHLDLRGVPEA